MEQILRINKWGEWGRPLFLEKKISDEIK